MNLGVMKQRAKERFRDLSALIVGDSTWDDHINAAYRHFIRAARWPFLVAFQDYPVLANVRMVALSDINLGNLENVYDDTNGRIVQPLPPLPWRFRLFLESQVPGEPAMYEVVGKNLYLIPPPKDAVTIRVFYFQDPAVLDDDADEPEIPLRYHEALISGALAKAHMDDQNLEAAERYQGEFDAIIDQARQELLPGFLNDPNGFVQGAMQPADETR